MPIGPQLPSPAGKRKRDAESSDDDSDSDDSVGPQLPPSKPTDDSLATKKQRVIGPSLPPSIGSNKNEPKVAKDEDSSASSDDDDFGPSLPTNVNEDKVPQRPKPTTSVETQSTSVTANAAQNTRDEWMTLAPASGDWSQRVDPTKLKNRKFNTGPSAGKTKSSADAWHETPEQKQARLQREVLGIKDSKDPRSQETLSTVDEKDAETARRMKEYNAQRGPSLFDKHQKSQKAQQEDDPSARAFDREKDIGGGLLDSTKRREMVKKSSDFNSRFSSAKYL